MKVTALIDDALIEKVKKASGGKSITESITIALKYYIKNQNLKYALKEIDEQPLQFHKDFTAHNIRKINRNL